MIEVETVIEIEIEGMCLSFEVHKGEVLILLNFLLDLSNNIEVSLGQHKVSNPRELKFQVPKS